MREVIAANVGLASRRRVKRKDDSARKNGAPPEWGEGKRCRYFTGSEDGRGPLEGEDPGGRRQRGEPAECRAPMEGVERRWRGRAWTEDWCRRRRLCVREG